MLLKSFPIEEWGLFIVHGQCHGGRWLGDIMSQGIYSNGIDSHIPAATLFIKKMTSYMYRNPHYKSRIVLRPSRVYNGNSYTNKTVPSLWIEAQNIQGPVSLSDKTSYCKILWSLKAMRFVFKLSNRSEIWQAPPQHCGTSTALHSTAASRLRILGEGVSVNIEMGPGFSPRRANLPRFVPYICNISHMPTANESCHTFPWHIPMLC